MSAVRPGPRNALTDVAGLTVGNAVDVKCQTGTTVILCGIMFHPRLLFLRYHPVQANTLPRKLPVFIATKIISRLL